MSARRRDPSEKGSAPVKEVSWVVGIGSSAGGLEALESFLGGVSPTDDLALIVAQHLAPEHKSVLTELLSRVSSLPIVEAMDGAQIRGGTVIVAPPGHDIWVDGTTLVVRTPENRFSPAPSIDILLGSLAEHWGSASVGVILSGTGSDGSLGLRAVHAAGGLCLVQTPASAAFDGMPRSAIAMGGLDVIAAPHDLGYQISLLSGSSSTELGAHLGDAPEDVWEVIVRELRRVTGVNFARYKRSTMNRQVKRRMAIAGVDDVHEYAARLSDDGDECRGLMNGLLVTVTEFFRDLEAFTALARHMGEYVSDHPNQLIRVWVPGCATGEEVYSLGMMIGEALGFPGDLNRRVKIFGTDLDEASLEIARRATYPSAALAQIPERLREHYAKPTADGFHIAEVLRECTAFARQDVTADPPFPQIDLLSCRNTLIYFDAELQRDVLDLFAFSVKPEGLLFLGKADGVPSDSADFIAIEAERRIFLRTGNRTVTAVPPAGASTVPRSKIPASRSTRPMPVPPLLEQQVMLLESALRASGDALVIIDEHDDIVHVVGDVGRFCLLPQGPRTASIGLNLRPELQAEVRALILLGRADQASIEGQLVHLDNEVSVRVTVYPLEVGDARFFLLRFDLDSDRELPRQRAPERDADFDRELQRLEKELQASQQVLYRSLAELQAANEELEATSEELQASMEELQSTNEELQAANEELQATNEELSTVNQEQRARGEQLERLNSDLENFQSSADQGMVLLDKALLIRRFTPKAVRVFALTPEDIGTSILDAPAAVPLPDLMGPLPRVLGGGTSETFDVTSTAGAFVVRLMPYRDRAGEIQGVVLTLSDISEMAVLRDQARDALNVAQERSQQLEQQSKVDALTSLLNRSEFAETLERELARCRRRSERLAVLWIDLDQFKEVNDGLGHEAGDVVLQVSATRLAASMRDTDAFGRLGGDEFGLVLVGPDNLNDLDIVLERIVDSYRRPIDTPTGEARISASVGVALYPEDGSEGEDLLRAADAAMYSVKGAGGDGSAYFAPAMNDEALERRRRRVALRHGLEHDEFTVFYQPIVRIDDGSVWGVEALLRWDNGSDLVSASDFVTYAEGSGQIRALGEIALREVSQDLSALRSAGHEDLSVSVNMSVLQLADQHLPEMLSRWFPAKDLQGIVIEVVESIFLPANKRAVEALNNLVDLGAKTAVDDFGSGYSNYRLLSVFAPAYIKLDQSLFNSVEGHAKQMALVASSTQVAQAFGAQVIAEGIESQEQWDLVSAAGVDLVQGYLLARAMPLNELLVWLDERGLRD